MRSLALVLVAASISACVKVAAYQHDAAAVDGDAPSDASVVPYGVTVTEPAPHIAELVGLYKMNFSAMGYHFPYSWGVGPNDNQRTFVLAGGPSGCTNERDFGLGFYPADLFSSLDGVAPRMLHNITVELAGPPIARVKLEYSTTLIGCGGVPRGRTIFTFFPDGRISRLDSVRMSTSEISNDCTCANNDSWYVTSFATFSRGVTRAVVIDTGDITFPVTPPPGNTTLSGEIPCIEGHAGWRIGVGWRNRVGGSRMRTLDANSFTLVSDLITTTTAIGGGAADDGLIGDEATTYWPSLDASCAQLRDRIDPFANNVPELAVDNGIVQMMTLAQDGTYGGEHGQQLIPGYTPGTSTFTISPAIGSLGPFALWVNFEGNTRDTPPIVTKMPTAGTGAWYSVQRPPLPTPRHYVFWFRDGLAAGESINIRAF